MREAEAIKALSLIHPVSRETIERLGRFKVLLERWQAKMNLVGPDTIPAFWTRHVADSLQALALFPDARRWADLGSGGGFPGLVIAIANAEHADRLHTLIESNSRKCAFLRLVALQTGAKVEIVNARIESVAQRLASRITPEIITARALAPLAQVLQWSLALFGESTAGLFHRGAGWRGEIEECRGLFAFDLVVHPSRAHPDSVLLEIRHPSPRAAQIS